MKLKAYWMFKVQIKNVSKTNHIIFHISLNVTTFEHFEIFNIQNLREN